MIIWISQAEKETSIKNNLMNEKIMRKKFNINKWVVLLYDNNNIIK